MKILFACVMSLLLVACVSDKSPSASDDMVMCTMDAKQCPDGSWVSRVPPKCKFAPCPKNDK